MKAISFILATLLAQGAMAATEFAPVGAKWVYEFESGRAPSYMPGTLIYTSVKDKGIGTPKDSLSKIWERFYKTDQSRGKDKKGTGLGLAIAKRVIILHRGTVEVQSEPDVGTTFKSCER